MYENDDLNHLSSQAQPFAREFDDARILRILSDRWIGNRNSEAVSTQMGYVFAQPRKTRMPCLLVTAASGMGKTMIATRFLHAHPPCLNEQTGTTLTSVVMIQMTGITCARQMLTRLLDELGAPMGKYQNIAMIENIAVQLMRSLGIKVLIIDELQDVLTGSARQQRACLNMLKLLANLLQISIIAFGVEESVIAICVDPQLESRFEHIHIPEWQEGEQLRGLLVALEQTLPLRRPSKLNTPSVARFLLRESRGVTGKIIEMINKSAVRAIRSEQEYVDEASLKALVAMDRPSALDSGRARHE